MKVPPLTDPALEATRVVSGMNPDPFNLRTQRTCGPALAQHRPTYASSTGPRGAHIPCSARSALVRNRSSSLRLGLRDTDVARLQTAETVADHEEESRNLGFAAVWVSNSVRAQIPCHSSKTSKKLLVSGVFVAPLLGREITEAELAFVAQRLVDELDPIQICQARFLPQLLSKDLPRLEHRIVSMACPEPGKRDRRDV